MADEMVSLAALAEQINSEHREIETALQGAVARAVAAGNLLKKAKSLVVHGQWAAWLLDNFEGSQRTAQAYMQLATELPKLPRLKAKHAADLSIRQALAEVACDVRRLATADPALLDDAIDEWEVSQIRHEDVPLEHSGLTSSFSAIRHAEDNAAQPVQQARNEAEKKDREIRRRVHEVLEKPAFQLAHKGGFAKLKDMQANAERARAAFDAAFIRHQKAVQQVAAVQSDLLDAARKWLEKTKPG